MRKQPHPIGEALIALRNDVRLLHLAAWVIDRARGEDREAMREAWKAKNRERDAFNVGAGRPDWPGERRVGLERFAKAIDELSARVRADGARLILISMPREPAREEEAPVLPLYNQAVADAAARLQAGFFDARSAVLAALRGPPAREWPELFLDAYHPNRTGHGLIALGLAPIVKALAAESRAKSATANH
jgi:lysophospholipase L1-like esterase